MPSIKNRYYLREIYQDQSIPRWIMVFNRMATMADSWVALNGSSKCN